MISTRSGAWARLGFAVLLFGSAFSTAPVYAQTPQRLFDWSSRTSSKAAGVQSEAIAVRLGTKALQALVPGDQLVVNLPVGSGHVATVDQVQDHGGGLLSVVGHLKDRGIDSRVVLTTGPAGTFGLIDTPAGQYRIVPGDGHDWLVDMAREQAFLPSGQREDDALRVEGFAPPRVDLAKAAYEVPVPGRTIVASAKAAPAPHLVIDVMFVVTQALAENLGATLSTRLQFLITRANTVFADSEIAVTTRMVHYNVVGYPPFANASALRHITPSDPSFRPEYFGHVEGLRAQYGADAVVLLRMGSSFSGSGLAWLGAPPDSGRIYSTVFGCTLSCEEVWIHELGHNMGAHHDRATAAQQSGGGTSYLGAGGSAMGYVFCKSSALTCNPFIANAAAGGCGSALPECSTNDPSNFRDVMSYFDGSSTLIARFSNASLACATPKGDGVARPCGIAAGQPDAADSAATLNANRIAVSAMQATKVVALPGSLQFTAQEFAGAESSRQIVFKVSRVGGSAGAASVGYALASGSATAGLDFTAVSGTLSWADGESAEKVFTVTVAADTSLEGAEGLTATLSNPTGAFLGYPASALGLVLEEFAGAAGGPLPPGFTSTDWTVSNDHAYDGTTSLRSGRPFGTFSTPANSDLLWTGVLQPGIISFAYRVSSAEDTGYLQFAVNNATVLFMGGETGWRSFQYTITTAGTYTLRWRFGNPTPVPCRQLISPPALAGNACADRVWIDSVSLPLALADASITLAASANPTIAGQAVTFTASVTGGSGAPEGTVDFRDGGSSIAGCGSMPLAPSGVASCTTNALPSGARDITATYAGSATYRGAVSATHVQAVQGAAQLLTASPASIAFGGQSISTTAPALTTTLTNTSGAPLTVTVTSPPGFPVSANTCATVAAGGTCQVTLAFTPAGEGMSSAVLALTYAGGGPTLVPVSGTGERSLVTHYYRSILRRAPDQGGKAFWEAEAARVQGLGSSVSEVWFALAQAFYFSGEYGAQNRDATGYVTDLYNTFFNRAPDTVGRDYWVGQIGAGLPREVVLVAFMFSSEFSAFTNAIFGTPGVRREIDTVVDFYRGLLARLPDSAGFNYWVGQFRLAQCAGAAAVNAQVEAISSAYANSGEYVARNRTNTQYMSDLYNAFMRRAGDLAGVQFWVGQLDSGARTREDVRRQFIQTPEFQGRVGQIISQGCLPQ